MNYFFSIALCSAASHHKLTRLNPSTRIFLACIVPEFDELQSSLTDRPLGHCSYCAIFVAKSQSLKAWAWRLRLSFISSSTCDKSSSLLFTQRFMWVSLRKKEKCSPFPALFQLSTTCKPVCVCVHGQNMCQSSGVAVSPSALAHCPQRLNANGAALLLLPVAKGNR